MNEREAVAAEIRRDAGVPTVTLAFAILPSTKAFGTPPL
jgi:hypothetical protein